MSRTYGWARCPASPSGSAVEENDLNQEITIRPATLDDIEDLVRLRRLMFESMGYREQAQLDANDSAVRAYLQESLLTGAFHGWLAVTPGGKAVGSSGAVVDRHPPGPNNPTGRVGYIMNIVTAPAYRRQGIARRMMETILSWMAENDVRHVSLHATEMGRPMYRSLGFVDTNEMRSTIDVPK
jgi:ribosomal protein S18 acetylase RimI-like enzyme